jgi:hypothetical protein
MHPPFGVHDQDTDVRALDRAMGAESGVELNVIFYFRSAA